MMRRKIFLLAGAVCLATACQATIRSTLTSPLTPDQTAELWRAPEPNRDLFLGVGGTRLAPDPTAPYKVIEVKRAGFSMGLTVEGPGQRKWSAKMPPEASTEVVASRLLWGVGYHQPPIYYVERWNADGAPESNPHLPARFRESKPDLHGLDSEEIWSRRRRSSRAWPGSTSGSTTAAGTECWSTA